MDNNTGIFYMTLYRRYIGNSLIPYSLWEDVVDVDGEEDGTHRASLTQSSLQLHWLRQRLAHANLHHRARVQRLDEGVRPPRHSIVAQLHEKGFVGYAIVRLLEVHEAEVHRRG